jgi:hypothetical protein
MPRRAEYEEDGDEGFDAPEDEDEPTVPCPYCRRLILEDSPRCPHCERCISAEDAPPTRKPWWIIGGTVACLYAIFRWIAG